MSGTEEVDPLRAEFIDESLDGLAVVSDLFVKLEADPGDIEVVQSIFRPVHSIKGAAAYFGLMHTKSLSHEMETLLDLVRKGALTPHAGIINVLLRSTDELAAMLRRVRGGEDECLDGLAFEELLHTVKTAAEREKWGEEQLWRELMRELAKSGLPETLELANQLARLRMPAKIPAAESISAVPTSGVPAGQEKTSADAPPAETDARQTTARTMRIPEESIDAFLAHVGDLVTIGEMYQHLHSNLTGGGDSQKAAIELRRVNEAFGELSIALQASIMGIRKVPFATLLQRAPRLVRDIASSSGKSIETKVVGGEITADKSLIDALEAPLVHMVRNAADHGIEPSERRKADGKPPTGTVEVIASETDEEVILTIKDDGGGIDRAALARKAAEIGLIEQGVALSDEDMLSLLFRSGVSTAEKVTDVSGRGVGMDVVRREVEARGGRITVASTLREGTEFRVRLPKTVSTQILTGFIVVIDERRYVLPLERVTRCFRLEADAACAVQDGVECVRDDDRFIRVCRLSQVFGFQAGRNSKLGGVEDLLVVAEAKSGRIALAVDMIEGVRQVVLKKIKGLPLANAVILGGAVMGDGTVAMILDVDHLVERSVVAGAATS